MFLLSKIKRKEKKGQKEGKRRKKIFILLFSSSLPSTAKVFSILFHHFLHHFLTNFQRNFKGKKTEKGEEEVQEKTGQLVFTRFQEVSGFSCFAKSTGVEQLKEVVCAIIEVVLFRGLSDFIHRESDLHVLRPVGFSVFEIVLYNRTWVVFPHSHILSNFQKRELYSPKLDYGLANKVCKQRPEHDLDKSYVNQMDYRNKCSSRDLEVLEYNERVQEISNESLLLGEKILDSKIVRKVFQSLPRKFDMKVTVIEEAHNIRTLKLDELFGSLLTLEMGIFDRENKKGKGITFKSIYEEETTVNQSDNKANMDESIALLTKQFSKTSNPIGIRSHKRERSHRISPSCLCQKSGDLEGHPCGESLTWRLVQSKLQQNHAFQVTRS
uniref:Gag-pol polyprotein n=1 Tax=Cucumis melo TaxID=3656 RepID=A0A9I9EK25_CUCME